MQETTLICKICENTSQNKIHIAKEMMFGLRDEFEYFECSNCGCLQIKEIPQNISTYYPEDYYSLMSVTIRDNFIKKYFRVKRDRYAVNQKGIIGRIISILKPPSPSLISLKKCGITVGANILDIGCGTGQLLLELKQLGFTNLTGIDPYIKSDNIFDNGVRVFKKEISAMDGKYEVIMFHHSFEHMAEPLQVFRNIYRLLNQNGCALIRIPTTSSYAWKHYGVNWVQLDAPRHLFLHSLKSIGILASAVNLRIKEITYDSTEFQFWGSEQYTRGIFLQEEKSYGRNAEKSIFTKNEINTFKLKASQLNKERLGDQMCIYLTKK